MRLPTVLLTLLALASCSSPDTRSAQPDSAKPDSAFSALQSRGKEVMGVDQYTSAHVFEDLPDGGRILLDRDDASDSASIVTIRLHMRQIASDFRAGEFVKPFHVHAMTVSGTATMKELRDRIAYEITDRPRGAELRMRSTDSRAVAAIHEFMKFQRSDHRAPGHEGQMHGGARGDTTTAPRR
jgi:hypothetical protein